MQKHQVKEHSNTASLGKKGWLCILGGVKFQLWTAKLNGTSLPCLQSKMKYTGVKLGIAVSCVVSLDYGVAKSTKIWPVFKSDMRLTMNNNETYWFCIAKKYTRNKFVETFSLDIISQVLYCKSSAETQTKVIKNNKEKYLLY